MTKTFNRLLYSATALAFLSMAQPANAQTLPPVSQDGTPFPAPNSNMTSTNEDVEYGPANGGWVAGRVDFPPTDNPQWFWLPFTPVPSDYSKCQAFYQAIMIQAQTVLNWLQRNRYPNPSLATATLQEVCGSPPSGGGGGGGYQSEIILLATPPGTMHVPPGAPTPPAGYTLVAGGVNVITKNVGCAPCESRLKDFGYYDYKDSQGNLSPVPPPITPTGWYGSCNSEPSSSAMAAALIWAQQWRLQHHAYATIVKDPDCQPGS